MISIKFKRKLGPNVVKISQNRLPREITTPPAGPTRIHNTTAMTSKELNLDPARDF